MKGACKGGGDEKHTCNEAHEEHSDCLHHYVENLGSDGLEVYKSKNKREKNAFHGHIQK